MSLSDDLERLQSLRERGALSDDEYARAKARVLDDATRAEGMPSPTAGPGSAASPASLLHRLARSRTDRLIGGVCGGLGKHTDLPSWAWRVIFCVVSLYFGAGLLFYILLWIFLPLEPI